MLETSKTPGQGFQIRSGVWHCLIQQNSQSVYCSLCLLCIFGGKNPLGQPNLEDGELLLEVDCNSGLTSKLKWLDVGFLFDNLGYNFYYI